MSAIQDASDTAESVVLKFLRERGPQSQDDIVEALTSEFGIARDDAERAVRTLVARGLIAPNFDWTLRLSEAR